MPALSGIATCSHKNPLHGRDTERIQSYCAIQDRCQWEFEKKMKEWGISDEIIENILTDLILDKFVNEERFSESFCRGK